MNLAVLSTLKVHVRCQTCTDFLEAALRDRFGKKQVVRQGSVVLSVRGCETWLQVVPTYDPAGRPDGRLAVRWKDSNGVWREWPDPRRSTIGVLLGEVELSLSTEQTLFGASEK